MAVGTIRGTNLGGAYVTVEAEIGSFGAKLIAKMRAELKEASTEARVRGREIGKELADGILQGFMRRLPGLRQEISAAIRSIDATVRVRVNVDDPGTRRVTLDVDVDEDSTDRARERVSNMGRQIQRDFSEMFGPFIGRIAGVVAGLSETAASALSKIKTVAGTALGSATALAAGLEVAYAVLVVAVGAMNALGRETLNLLKMGLAMPGVLAAILAVAAPMYVVFSGLDKVFADIFNKDPKKANAALNSLTGSVRAFAVELRNAKPWYDQLVASTREAFFENLVGRIPQAIALLGPAVKAGFTNVANGVSRILGTILDKLKSPKTLDAIKKVFDTVGKVLDRFQGPAGNFFTAMGKAVVAALPFIEVLSGKIANLADDFSKWLGEKIDSGEFQEWMNDASDTLDDVIELVKELTGLLGVLFDDPNKEGESFIAVIAEIIHDLKVFAESPEGQRALEGIATAAKLALTAFVLLTYAIAVITAALGSLVWAISEVIDWFKKLFGVASASSIGGAAGKAIKVAAKGGGMGHFADGGIITSPTVATFAEDGPEVAIPLTKPARARQLVRESGLMSLMGSGQQSINVLVQIGNEQLDSRVTRVISKTVGDAVAAARTGGLAPAPI